MLCWFCCSFLAEAGSSRGSPCPGCQETTHPTGHPGSQRIASRSRALRSGLLRMRGGVTSGVSTWLLLPPPAKISERLHGSSQDKRLKDCGLAAPWGKASSLSPRLQGWDARSACFPPACLCPTQQPRILAHLGEQRLLQAPAAGPVSAPRKDAAAWPAPAKCCSGTRQQEEEGHNGLSYCSARGAGLFSILVPAFPGLPRAGGFEAAVPPCWLLGVGVDTGSCHRYFLDGSGFWPLLWLCSLFQGLEGEEHLLALIRHLALAARLVTLGTEQVVAPARGNLWGAVWVHGCWWCWGWCGVLGQLAQGGLATHSSGRRFVSLPELPVPASPPKAARRCD